MQLSNITTYIWYFQINNPALMQQLDERETALQEVIEMLLTWTNVDMYTHQKFATSDSSDFPMQASTCRSSTG